MALSDNVIVGYAEAKNVVRSGRDVWEFSGEILDSLLEYTSLERQEIDGLLVTQSQSGTSTFWSQCTGEYLGLETNYSDLVDLGGCSAAGAVARASAAIDAGLCETIVLINADAPSTQNATNIRTFHEEWTDPSGLMGPPGAFGLLSNRYDHLYGLDIEALGKLAVTQRDHAILNPNAVERFRQPITIDDYRNSRVIADPIKLLDCVMLCDGGNGFVMMSRKRAREKGFNKFVVPRGYGERSNYQADRNNIDITTSGHIVAGERALGQAGIGLKDIGSIYPYDDFLIAIMMTFENLGYCKPGQGAAFIHERNFHYNGDLPLNTGGGQISSGQAGLAGGGTNLVEAVRQLFSEGGDRQIADTECALVTGIGWIPYGRNWFSSVALILEPDS